MLSTESRHAFLNNAGSINMDVSISTFGYGPVAIFTALSLIYYIIFEALVFTTKWNTLMKIWSFCLLGILQASISSMILLENTFPYEYIQQIITYWSHISIAWVAFSITYFAIILFLCSALKYHPSKTASLCKFAVILCFIA